MAKTFWINLQRITLSEKKSIPKDHILYYSIYVTYFTCQNYRKEKISGCQGLRRVGVEWKWA